MYLRVLENEVRNARPSRGRKAQFEESYLEVRMFNIGHGECILIIFDGDRGWLIDSGSNSITRNRVLGENLINYLEQHSLH